MKKIIVLAVVALSVITAKADGWERDRIIGINELPKIARSFIDKYLPDVKISYIKEDREFLDKNFEVAFSNGVKLEFLRNGEWKEVDFRNSQVPSDILPDEIEKYVSEHYAGERILQIDRDRNDYEVRLSNRLELTFDKKFNIIDIDD